MEEIRIRTEMPKEITHMFNLILERLNKIEKHINQEDAKLLSLREFREMTGIAETTVYQWIKKNKIETVKIGGRRLVKINESLNHNGATL